MYDFDTKTAKAIIYTNNGSATVPVEELSSWSAETTLSTGFSSVDGIRLASGALMSGLVTPGETLFDEVRVGRTWAELLRHGSPSPTNYVVDADNIVTDAQMTGGVYSISVDLYAPSGVDTDGVPFAPRL